MPRIKNISSRQNIMVHDHYSSHGRRHAERAFQFILGLVGFTSLLDLHTQSDEEEEREPPDSKVK